MYSFIGYRREICRVSRLGIGIVAALGCFAVGLVDSATAGGDIPIPPNVEVQPADALNGLVFAPDSPSPIPASQIVVTARNAVNQPIPFPNTEVIVSNANALCPDVVLQKTGNENGETSFTLAGGGCAANTALSGLIKVNGVTVRAYENVKGPDFDGSGGDRVVNLADLVSFSGEFLGSSPADCHDYDNDGMTGLDDLIIFAPAFIGPSHCP